MKTIKINVPSIKDIKDDLSKRKEEKLLRKLEKIQEKKMEVVEEPSEDEE